ncbi:MAG: YihY/virulence factor BrkB family protein [Desulfobacteraceae bacterium]|nr:YihY/virulence factor BrkB family protein [Desulfobacteraceae bacterium]
MNRLGGRANNSLDGGGLSALVALVSDPVRFRAVLDRWGKKAWSSVLVAARGFKEDNCMLRASALTFYTLLSIVPVMAMAFGIAKGFGFEKVLEKELLARLAGQEEAALKIIDFAGKILAETRGGVMAAVGVIFLVWAVVKMLGHMEEAFNAIWWVKDSRTLVRKFSDYIALLFTAPLLLILSGSFTVFVSTGLTRFFEAVGAPIILEILVSFCLKLLPFCTVWLLFFFLYVFIPNKKVEIKAALVGAVMAGTVYQLGQVIYIHFQVGVSHYNAIYGSFAALPLFLLWLQASWILLLVGGEIAFAWESRRFIIDPKEGGYEELSFRTRKILSLRIALVCVQRFARAEPSLSDSEISTALEIPLRVVRMLLTELVECNILSEVTTRSGPRFQPARDIDSLTVMTVVKAMEERGGSQLSVPGTMEFEALSDAVDAFAQVAARSHAERRLKDI